MPLGVTTKASKAIWNEWYDKNFAVQSAGEHIVISTTPATLSDAAYAAGDLIGGKLTFSNAARSTGGGGLVKSATLYDKLNVKAGLDLVLFDSNPSTTTFTDNAALAVDAADIDKVCGVVSFSAGIVSSYVAFNANAVAHRENLDIVFDAAAGVRDIYGALVSRAAASYISGGASPTTYTNLGIRLGIVQG